MPTAQSQALSLGLHIALIALLLVLASQSTRRTTQVVPNMSFVPLVLHRRPEQRAGGSNRTPLPAKRGAPPPRALRTFIPPVHRPDPLLPMPVTVAFDTSAIRIATSAIGDPFSKFADGDLGMTGRNGIGDGCCQGVGDSHGRTPGFSGGAKITPPELIYKVEPEFSEEARKAKYQGMVVLTIEVDAGGRVRNPRILQHLGLGLDERAMEAVSRWRFRPGLRNGQPVETEAVVQVTFQLL